MCNLVGRFSFAYKGRPETAICYDFDGTLTIAPGEISMAFKEPHIPPLLLKTDEIEHVTVWVAPGSRNSPTSEPTAAEAARSSRSIESKYS